MKQDKLQNMLVIISWLFFVPLLGLAPLVDFVGFYLLGYYFVGDGIFRGFGLLVFFVSSFIIPFSVAAIFAIRPKVRLPIRITLFFCALVAQICIFFTFNQPLTYEMMGMAHRLQHEFPPDQLRDCADQLRQRFHDGTLKVNDRNKDVHYAHMVESAVVVADLELPLSLRGRFQQVFIQKDKFNGDEQVVFAFGSRTGIICDSRKNLRGFFEYSMADGVEAYRDMRN